MQYFSIANIKSKKHPLMYKYHIKGPENAFLCGLAVKNEHVEAPTDFNHLLICENCQNIVNGVPFMRNESFRRYAVRKLTEHINLNAEDFRSELSKSCAFLTNEFESRGFSCEPIITYESDNTTMGKVMFHTSKYKNMYIKFTHKPYNKHKLRFEKPVRDYLTLPFSRVLE